MRSKLLLALGLLLFLVGTFGPGLSRAQEVPKNFLYHKETLIRTIKEDWPSISIPSVIPGLIEQESCTSLTHRRCWSVRSELLTKHEHGLGLGQFTVTKKFNAWDETKALNTKLKDWSWDRDRFDARYQMLFILTKVRQNWKSFPSAHNEYERFAFALAAYNGGLGGTLGEQRMCKNIPGCDRTKWFGNVELHSRKTRKGFNGFSKSAFQINREYPVNILTKRRLKYKEYVDPHFPDRRKEW